MGCKYEWQCYQYEEHLELSRENSSEKLGKTAKKCIYLLWPILLGTSQSPSPLK